MNSLYPIIRRARRPLLPPDEQHVASVPERAAAILSAENAPPSPAENADEKPPAPTEPEQKIESARQPDY